MNGQQSQWGYPSHRTPQHHPQQYSQHQYASRPQGSPDTNGTRFAPQDSDSVHQAHSLLAVYPTASASPSSHVARHLSNLTLTATTPAYMNHSYIVPSQDTTGQSSLYANYNRELDYLSSRHTPNDNRAYWDNVRGQTAGVLTTGFANSQLPGHHSLPSQWAQSHGTMSAYQPPAFVSSVFHRVSPASAYPTPPPPAMHSSSSSLAHALGFPAQQQQQQQQQQQRQSQQQYQQSQPQHEYHRQHQQPNSPAKPTADESPAFFDTFLQSRLQVLEQENHVQRPMEHELDILAPVDQKTGHVRPETPKRLILPPPARHTPNNFISWSNQTSPQKRKREEGHDTPSIKRMASGQLRDAPKKPLVPKASHPQKSRQIMAYVEIPSRPPLVTSRSSQRPRPASPDDLGGYGSVEDDPAPTKTRIHSNKPNSSRRTGDRDERVPLEKFSALIEDIFEAEDTLPADTEISELPKNFFSPLTPDCNQPHLQTGLIRKLTNYISQLARPTKRLRRPMKDGLVSGAGSPRTWGSLADVETNVLARLFKILERSVKAGEDLDPFGLTSLNAEILTSPRKPKTRKAAKPSASQREGSRGTPKLDDMQVDDEPSQSKASSAERLAGVDGNFVVRQLEIAKDSIVAAECCISLLSGEDLTKQLYSEELITTCLRAIKNQLENVVYAFLEYVGQSSPPSPQLLLLQKNLHPSSREVRRELGELFQALSAIFPRVDSLISRENLVMSDSIIIQTVYIAIGPFFVVESLPDNEGKGKDNNVAQILGKSAMRGLRLEAMSLIRSIFAKHEDQRSWIIEEILTSLIKLSDSNKKTSQFRLRDGRSIRTVSALLLQLVQTSAHDVRVAARRIHKDRQRNVAMRRNDSFHEKHPEPVLDELDDEEIRLYGGGLESAANAAKTVVLFLTQRSGKGKQTKSSNEAEYRSILDGLISDVLSVLFWPEWPAASLLLTILCKFMISTLDDVKTSNQADTNGAKSIALDHLGVIAARIRSSALKVNDRKKRPLQPMDEIVAKHSVDELNRLLSKHVDILSNLCQRLSDDPACNSARELAAATLGQELSSALKNQCVILEAEDNDEPESVRDKRTVLCTKLKDALRGVWTDHTVDVFNVGSQEEVARIDQLAEEIGTIQGLRSSFNPILNVILVALDAPPVFMRTKALRALGQIVTSDPSVLAMANVRRAIESHLLDSSPAVRDAAVELIGKYMIDSPEVASDYYKRISERIADTGLGVRKRVIKLLRAYYFVEDSLSCRIDIATRMVLRMLDEDETVRDLAVKTIEELWFQGAGQGSSNSKPRSANGDKAPLLSKVSVIMGVSANFKDRQSPLEDMLHRIMAQGDDTVETASLRSSYSEICETLIDGLVDATELPGFTIQTCIRTIYLFTTSYPHVLSGANASTLLPYLKNPTSAEELAISDYLLKIFRISIPHMPKTAVKFGQELQLILQPMILKPSSAGGVSGLQEAVACICMVVKHLTHDFTRLVGLLKSCNLRLQQAINRPANQEMNQMEAKSLSILIFIVSLLAEHCDFDHLREEDQSLTVDLDTVAQGSIVLHIYDSLLRLYRKVNNAGLKGRVLQCLGFLFRAQPSLMTVDSSATIMDDIFQSTDEDSRGRLLKIMHDFLAAEAAKHSAQEKLNAQKKTNNSSVNMEELVGNTDGFADSGVSSAIVQRYIDYILEAVLSQNHQIQSVAVDILTFTVKQGLAHPLQSFPYIVALETSPSAQLCARANALHAVLHSKHMSLLNARYIVSARRSFDYQKKIVTGVPHGYRSQPDPVALLQRWYSLVREKRNTRQDLLRALLKVFDISGSLKSSQDDVEFARYMAENFSALEYKTQEEVLTVIKSLTSVLSTTGMQIVEALSPSNLLAQLRGTSAPMVMIEQIQGSEVSDPQQGQDQTNNARTVDVDLMRSSIIIGMVMILKTHLKHLYGLSEEKCSKFVIGKKSVIGDKPAVRRHQHAIIWDRLPFVTTAMSDTDMEAQRTTFLEVWNADGVSREPEDEFE
ncbi:hypothetical protein CONPUDRAFT_165445 [Coniophora puteana RWD-64-598 SS2]|uniref:Sister chromatid cohesion protein n=1 Tax=Coniophora puteana (strain RWD-64-598) TaxID=741705 RepID=A0A5M3MR72_CONPW|nr:uncharacterized protein CONPUDRAFT_165445 [Coniophora puteana RWD-64-598 SS2]EIW81234.1 hypothetical protein CONPUDRAFT_165445 [Coniophora puteana RWD-64-598 SS2]